MYFRCTIRKEKFAGRKLFIINRRYHNSRNVKGYNNDNNVNNKKVVLYIHGGAYITNIGEEHWRIFEDITLKTDYTVIAPDYPLLPKYNYKDVFNMIRPLYDEIASRVGSNNIILMGDSAGGGMALGLTEMLNNEEKDLPSKVILISPWIDVSLTNEYIKEVQKRDKVLNYILLRIAGHKYSDNDDKNYLASPLYGMLTGNSNICIFIGTNDIFYPDVMSFKEKIDELNKQDGNDIDLKVILRENMEHIWVLRRKYRYKEDYNKLLEEILN